MQNKTFKFGNVEYEYLKEGFNWAGDNERTIQIPLAEKFIDNAEENIIEFPFISRFYFKKDIRAYDIISETILKSDMHILSIADIDKLDNAVNALNKILNFALKHNRKFLIMWPVGKNKELDKMVMQIKGPYVYSFYRDEDNNWRQEVVDRNKVLNTQYNSPYKWGNGLLVLTNDLDLWKSTAKPVEEQVEKPLSKSSKKRRSKQRTPVVKTENPPKLWTPENTEDTR